MHITTKEEAMRLGLNTYFPGKQCARGHIGEWYVRKGGGCVQCSRKLAREYQARCGKRRDSQGPRNSSIPKEPTIPGARLILGRCQSGSH